MTALSPADVATVKAAQEHAAPVLKQNNPDPRAYMLAAFIEDLARIIRQLDAEVSAITSAQITAAREALSLYRRDRWTAAQPLAEALSRLLDAMGAGQ